MEKLVKHTDGNSIDSIFPHADEAMENVKEKGNEYWKMVKTEGQNLLSGAQSNSRKIWKWTKGIIQKNPEQAVGYAVLLGALIAVLLYPKRKD